MGFQRYFILLALLCADISKGEDACYHIQSCFEPLMDKSTFSQFIPGSDLNHDICEHAAGEVFDCVGPILHECHDNEVVVQSEVIQTEIAYLCHGWDFIPDLRESFCVEEPAKGQFREEIRDCLTRTQGHLDRYLQDEDFCHASILLKHCVQNGAGPCGPDFQEFYDILFLQNPRLPNPNGRECYGEFLAADFITQSMLAGGEEETKKH